MTSSIVSKEYHGTRKVLNTETTSYLGRPSLISTPMDILNLIKEEIAKTSCATFQSEFLTKLSSRLWKIPHFFISLLFKKNEDINPTKASDLDMNPDHYNLTLEKVDQFLKEDLIKNSTLPPWACEAFYANKRAEKV